jgi:phospholipid/cholesterol/gamma-HCH transport system substrate-binding protein
MSTDARYRRAAVVAAVLLLALSVFVFAKGRLFGSGYEIRAVVSTATQLRSGSEVRIGGIKVGQVTGVDAGPDNTSVLTMAIDDAGRPVHADASLIVKPRLLLEGNAYVDLSPGSPAAREIAEGATIPRSRTAVTPQLDQVLNTFDTPTRDALHRAIAGLAGGLGGAPATPRAATGSGYRGLRRAVTELNGALGSVTVSAKAARGTAPNDLGRAVSGSADTVEQLAHDPRALADSVTNFNRVMQAISGSEAHIAASIRGFDEVLRAAPSPLERIDAALPRLTQFASALRPALRELPGALRPTNALLEQVGAISRPAELPRLMTRLAPMTARLPTLERRLRALFAYTAPVTDCIATHIVPVLTSKIQDGKQTTGDPAWLDLLHAITGFTSASTSYDGNGGTFRAGLAFGPTALQGIIPGLGPVVGRFTPVEGIRPVWLGYGVEPPYRPDAPCADQKLPDLNAQAGPPPAWMRNATPILPRGKR